MSDRKIDALIAEHVMGLEVTWEITKIGRNIPWLNTEDGLDLLPYYSTKISDAWEVIETLNCLNVSVNRENCMGVRYDIIIYDDLDLKDKVVVTEDAAPMAICLAALKLKGIKV